MLLDRVLHPAVLFLFAVGFLPTAVAKPKDAILLSDVQSLTLRADRQTTHRRVPAAPQLKCVSHRSVCGLHKVDVMRCTNQGSSYGDEDIQWSCTASLPPELKLGSTEVVCEGYSSPQDPYVLKGSCGVEYKLILTDEGHRRYPDLGGGGGSSGDGSLPTWVFWVFFTVVVVIIVGTTTRMTEATAASAAVGVLGAGLAVPALLGLTPAPALALDTKAPALVQPADVEPL
ncbi:hypothetical protein MAPG_06337 [Magnaporthiopsis poae ATCC 64411]|uniref:Store-operated calcium entry-associated regulatory factor n=1 Tax=Magnaporthiopsis poae (strain ATCC 64411 / 73-15) TaxID=644358 RepID=A0A0C4E1R7_MAGP6|nr:hypothetical protein MAPG_06337 [Magnaporthiopsis poae ATCC 64411]